MAILERVEPLRLRWSPATTPPVAVRDTEYPARHRQSGRRRLSLLALFYVAAHAHYVPRHTRASSPAARYLPRHSRLG